MNKSETEESNTLCCCEYYDNNNRRNHILLCCCNCADLDEGFEDLISGHPLSKNRKSSIMSTIQDRMRIPCRGGAKKMTKDTVIPMILVPLLIFFASIDPVTSIFTVIVLLLTSTCISNCFYVKNPRTKFYIAWACMSIITIALIFEIKVIAMLEILPEENISLAVLFFVSLGLVHVTRSRAPKFRISILGDVDDNGDVNRNDENFCKSCWKEIDEQTQHCQICQVCVPERDFHFYWYDCCIGQTNNGYFMLSLLFSVITLLYSSNLTLTSVCHPFTFIGTVMLPDDCSEVYEQLDMSMCFVSAIYSIFLALYLLWVLLRHCLFTSLGITGYEWEGYSFRTKLFCGYGSKRTYTLGCFKNWYKLLFYKTKQRNSFIET